MLLRGKNDIWREWMISVWRGAYIIDIFIVLFNQKIGDVVKCRLSVNDECTLFSVFCVYFFANLLMIGLTTAKSVKPAPS